MEDRLYVRPYRSGDLAVPRWVAIKLTIAALVAAVIGVAVLLLLPGKPAPTVAGLRQIPRSALEQLNTHLGTHGPEYISVRPAGTSTLSLAGAAVLGRKGNTMQVEVSTRSYFRPKRRPPKGAPAGWEGTEDYSVLLIRTSPGHWRVANIELIPEPQVHEG